MAWYDSKFGGFISDMLTSGVGAIEKGVNKGFDAAEKKIDRVDDALQKVGTGIDSAYETGKHAVSNRDLGRDQVIDTIDNVKKINEGVHDLKKEF